jgi:S-adenosylmethionine:tRNA ribosyltransferase-isomerase
MEMSLLDYDLPAELIATEPTEQRDQSRLMVVRRSSGQVEHRWFLELLEILSPTDLLVFNDTRVIPAKLELRRATGGLITGLFLAEEHPGSWRVMLRSRGRLAVGDVLRAGEWSFTIVERLTDKGHWRVCVDPVVGASEILAAIGHVPLPPYIEKARRAGHQHPSEENDRQRYQTVYAKQQGSLAAPTAGLHFTDGLLAGLQQRGIRQAFLTLHVGLGTFLPVEAATLEEHQMHSEEYFVPVATVETLRRQRAQGHRIAVVGTTAVRTLESCASQILDGNAAADIHGSTTLKISPGYNLRLTDVLITNFHLPRSTLMALVATLVGLDCLKELYQLAIAERYRFFSYGDAMIILP